MPCALQPKAESKKIDARCSKGYRTRSIAHSLSPSLNKFLTGMHQLQFTKITQTSIFRDESILSNLKKRNYGFGNKMQWAGEQALYRAALERGGRYSWLKTNMYRWRLFCKFCTQKNINDARDIDTKLVEDYGKTLANYSASAQQNYLSSINVTMNLLAGSEWEKVSPSKTSKTRRCNIRSIPSNITRQQLDAASQDIKMNFGDQPSYLVQICYEFGLRRREGLLFEFHVAKKQAAFSGKIDVIRGTKGGRGRSVERIVPVRETGFKLLESVCEAFPNSRCLLLESSYKFASEKISRDILPILKKYGIARLHELRVAYTCRRYYELTGFEPSCNQPNLVIDKILDRAARSIIATELGHSRIDIVNAYIGCPKWKKPQDRLI